MGGGAGASSRQTIARVTTHFVIHPDAETDIQEAHGWYEDRSIGLGERFLHSVGEAFAAIRETPQRFPRVYDEPDLSIRRALIEGFPYGAFFIWDENRGIISVIACMHVRRDPRRWLRRA